MKRTPHYIYFYEACNHNLIIGDVRTNKAQRKVPLAKKHPPTCITTSHWIGIANGGEAVRITRAQARQFLKDGKRITFSCYNKTPKPVRIGILTYF